MSLRSLTKEKVKCNHCGSLSQKGLSLIELMIALTLSSILGLALFEVFNIARNSFDQVIDSNDTLDSAQSSFSLLQDAINMAGFWGGVAPEDLHVVSKTLSAYPGKCDGQWVLDLSFGLQGFDGRETSSKIPSLPKSCLSKDYVPHSDVIITRRASAIDEVPEAKLNNKYYRKRFIVRGNPETGGVVFQGRDLARGLKVVPKSEVVNNRLLRIDMYYLEYCKDDSICDASGVGLSRYTLAGDRFIKQRLVNGVAQMQFEYGVDKDGDDKVEQYITADEVIDWHKVKSVRMFGLFKGSVSGKGQGYQESVFKLGSDFELELSAEQSRYQYKKFQTEFFMKNT